MAAIERLEALTALALHTPVLVKYDDGLEFRVDARRLRAAIRKPVPRSATALQLIDLWRQLEDHAARHTRNSITHKLSTAAMSAPLVWFEEVYVGTGARPRYEHKYLVGRRAGEGSIAPDALLQSALQAAKEQYALTVRLAVTDDATLTPL